MTRRLVLAAVLLLAPTRARADVTLRATLEPPQARVGEQVDLAVEAQGSQAAPAPSIPGVDGLTIRYVGPATQVSIVNGQMTSSISHHFTVVAARPGTFTIGPLAVTVGGKTYTAGPVTLQALPSGAAGGGPGGDQLRLALSVAKPEVYLHERVPVALTLSIGSVRVADLQYPTIPGDGFLIEKFPEPSQRQEHTAQGNFQVFDFQTVLTPLRSGPLVVGPAVMHMSLLERSRRQDPFFGSMFGDNRRGIDLQSEALTLGVLPLPDAGRPADFSGAVGRFELDVQAGPLAVTAGDPVTVRSIIRGAGYLEGVTPPTVAAGDALRVYPVQPQAGAAGEKVFEQVVIPQRAGTLVIPSPRFSYFDPAVRSYQTAERPAISLTVRPAAAGSPQIVGVAPARERPEALGRDLVSIKDAPGTLQPIGARRYRSAAFWSVQALPLLAWIGALAWDRRRQRLSGDLRYARFTRAGRAARQAIAAAQAALRSGDAGAFYDTVERALREYLAAKLDLPPGGVSADAVAERLQRRQLAPRLADDVRHVLAACEHARFAPARDAGADMERTLAQVEAIVRGLERERRLGRALAALWLLVALAAAGAGAAGESPNTLFFQGNTLYGEGRFAEAAAAYERVLAAGWESGNLHFNLGNAWFRAGDVGRAILGYERARRFLPGDPDLAANLGFARAQSGEEGAEEEPVWVRLLLPLGTRAGTDTLLLAASLCWAALMLVLATARLIPGMQRVAYPAAVVGAVVLAVLVPAAVYRLATVDLPDYAVVVAPADVAVRFEPSATGTAHFQAKPGAVLRVLATREGWTQVARRDGRRGWVAQDLVAAL